MLGMIRILGRSVKFMAGFLLLACVLLVVCVYPLANTANPKAPVGTIFDPPGGRLILGTDNFGRDVFLELMYGFRTSLAVGVLAGLIATVIGLTMGLLSGFIGGVVDNVLNTATNIFIVIPSFVILILLSVSLQTRTVGILALVIGVTAWPWTARAVRAQTASLRMRDHVNIARISGHSIPRLLLLSILPYVASYVFMAFILQMASGILAEASLSMLGLGPTDTISLGQMLNWAMLFEAPVKKAWWAFIPPALSIGLVTFSMYLMNSGMDEVFNPKLRK